MSGDPIRPPGYPVTVHDGYIRWCPSCQAIKAIYVQVAFGERLTCCGTCHLILRRIWERDYTGILP